MTASSRNLDPTIVLQPPITARTFTLPVYQRGIRLLVSAISQMWGSLTGSRSRTCDANIENASTNQERVTRLSWRHDRDFLLCSVQPNGRARARHVAKLQADSDRIQSSPLTGPLVDCDDHGLSLLEDSKHDSFGAFGRSADDVPFPPAVDRSWRLL